MATQSKKEEIRNVVDLRNALLSDFTGMKQGEVSIPLGKARTAAARTAISSAKTEMDYNKQVGEAEKRIEFLEQ